VAADVPNVRLHDLRHLHVSLLIKQGFDPRTVADRIGHKNASFTLDRYGKAFEEQRQATAISLADLLKPKTVAVGLN
jgi:integrase